MECLVKFAGDVNIIGIANSDVLLREIYALNATIAEVAKVPKTDQLHIAEIFSKPEWAAPAKEPAIRQSVDNPAKEPSSSTHINYEADEKVDTRLDTNIPNINVILKSAIRQSAILERIRQSGNCRLKDIQEILPDASERTIRYDLQTLLEQDVIERVGIAGPSVYYRAKQMA